MRRVRQRRRLAAAAVALIAVSAGAATVLSADGSDEHSKARTPVASLQTRTPPHPSPTAFTPRRPPRRHTPLRSRAAQEFLTGYLALLHRRGSERALRRDAARGLLRELRRVRPRVKPMQQRTRTRTLDLSTALPSPESARVVATLKDRGGAPSRLQLYLERRGARWVVTRIGDA